ncbi:hypothetical protein [Rummeliibacillus pycnus]|uniref:hypothetical protein n=1 Tax=Rummeliibacillus pycnus TaxID=101070 RepID=UPI0037C8A94A
MSIIDSEIKVEKNISNFTSSVRIAIKNENWYAALTTALTLPDICGELENPKLYSSKRYIQWFDEYMLSKYTVETQGQQEVHLNGNDAYALRCSYLHGGSADISDQDKQKVLSQFIFMAPKIVDGEFKGSHNNRVNTSLILRVDRFCEDVCTAIESWVLKNKAKSEIQNRVSNMVNIHEGSVIVDGVLIEL